MHFYLKMKQLDVDVSPPAFVWNLYLTLTNVTIESAHRAENDLYKKLHAD